MAVEKASISIAVEIVGSLLNKVRDYASNKLKDGDLTNEELRQVLVRDLNEINTKLDSLSLKDLDGSRRFLKEGMSFLILALDKPSEDQETREGPDEETDISTDCASGSLNAALTLPQAIQKLQFSSKKRLKEAKKSFQKAREDATHAFSNKSLSIKDRIMACKVRVAARIFESGLEDPEAAVSACLLALDELHGLPAIKDMLKVFLKGGMRSWRNKTERLENIMSVLFINHALFDFAAKCGSKYPNVFTWPLIEFADRTLHPILLAHVVTTSSSEEFGQQLNRMIVNWRIVFGYFWNFAVNSRGEIILLFDEKITVIYSSGRSKSVMFSDTSESNVVDRQGKAVAVDSDDNIYVVRYIETLDEYGEKEKFVLCVLDENCKLKHDSILLDFLKVREYRAVQIAVDKNKNIIMITYGDNQVYVCDNMGQVKSTFERCGRRVSNIDIINEGDIMVRSDDRSAVYVYTTEGDLKSTIKVPESHEVVQVAFHHGICRIIVLTMVRQEDGQKSCYLLCYTETGELENSVQGLPWCSSIASLPSGTFAVLQDKSITFI